MKTNGVRDVGYMCAYMCESGEGIHFLPFPVLISLNSLTEASWP